MEAEEEWNKDLSAHKLLDKKVLCKQNGRIGKFFMSAFTIRTQLVNVFTAR